jgi:hypothetical protein
VRTTTRPACWTRRTAARDWTRDLKKALELSWNAGGTGVTAKKRWRWRPERLRRS